MIEKLKTRQAMLAMELEELSRERQRIDVRLKIAEARLLEINWVIAEVAKSDNDDQSSNPTASETSPRRNIRQAVKQAIDDSQGKGKSVAELCSELDARPVSVDLAIAWLSDPKRRSIVEYRGRWYGDLVPIEGMEEQQQAEPAPESVPVDGQKQPGEIRDLYGEAAK